MPWRSPPRAPGSSSTTSGRRCPAMASTSPPPRRWSPISRRPAARRRVNYEDIADWQAARRTIEQAYDTYGQLDILVNNAGVLRDRMAFNLAEDEFDLVMRVHCKGHFAMTRHACARWRERAKQDGQRVRPRDQHVLGSRPDGHGREQQLRDGQGGDRGADHQHRARDGEVRGDRRTSSRRGPARA